MYSRESDQSSSTLTLPGLELQAKPKFSKGDTAINVRRLYLYFQEKIGSIDDYQKRKERYRKAQLKRFNSEAQMAYLNYGLSFPPRDPEPTQVRHKGLLIEEGQDYVKLNHPSIGWLVIVTSSILKEHPYGTFTYFSPTAGTALADSRDAFNYGLQIMHKTQEVFSTPRRRLQPTLAS